MHNILYCQGKMLLLNINLLTIGLLFNILFFSRAAVIKSNIGFDAVNESSNEILMSYFSDEISPVKEVTDENIVELAIVFDHEFGELFQFNMERITVYLKALLWDVNLRFKTLPSSKLSFRVTSVTIIKSVQGQPFLENERQEDGTVNVVNVSKRFKKWIYTRLDSLPKFDIAMAIISCSRRNRKDVGTAHFLGVCKIDQNMQQVNSTLVVTLQENVNPASVIAHEMAHVLGILHDDEEYKVSASGILKNICKAYNYTTTSNYIMSRRSAYQEEFDFSPCSNNFISNLVKRGYWNCLRRLDSDIKPLIDTSPQSSVEAAIFQGIPMSEQCHVFKKGSFAPDKPDEESCTLLDRCASGTVDDRLYNFHLNPLQGTPCGRNGRCFRGKCLSVGVQIMNIGTKKCLVSRNHSVHDDFPKLVDCARSATPLSLIILRDMGSLGKFLLTPFASLEETEVHNIDHKKGHAVRVIESFKCLTFAENVSGEIFPTFDLCPYGTNELFGWDFVEVEKGEYLILHHQLNSLCLGLSENSSGVMVTRNCSVDNIGTRWTFLTESNTQITLEDAIQKENP